MAILTKSRLTTITESKLGVRMFTETLNDSRKQYRDSGTVTVFLSHSHDDLEKGDLNKIIVFLRNTGIKIYIDSNDLSLPPFTNEETAKRIKE